MKQLQVGEQIELLKKHNLISDQEVYDMATLAGEIETKKVSDRQIELLKKFAENRMSREEIKEYISLQFIDNPFNFYYVPKLEFYASKICDGEYYKGRIKISTKLVDSFFINDIGLPMLLDTIGHEWRHCLQKNINMTEMLDQDNQCIKKIKDSYDNYFDLDPSIINGLHGIESKDMQQKVSRFLKKHLAGTNVEKWYEELTSEERDSICFKVFDGEYYQRVAEEDARVGGMLYANLMISRLERDQRVQKNEKLFEYIKKSKKELSNLEEEYVVCLNKYKHIQDFKSAMSKVDFDMLFEMAKYILKVNKTYKNSDEYNMREEAVSSLLAVCAASYAEQHDYEYLQQTYNDLKNDLLGQNKLSSNAKRYLATKMLPLVVFQKASKQNENMLDFNEKISKDAEELYNILWQNRKSHKFDQEDSFLLIFNCFGYLSDAKIKQLKTYLREENRLVEYCNMVSYIDLYNFDAGFESDMNSVYEKKVDLLMSRKYEDLMKMGDYYLDLDMSTKENYCAAFDYTSAVENFLARDLDTMIDHKAKVNPKKYYSIEIDYASKCGYLEYNYDVLKKELKIDDLALYKIERQMVNRFAKEKVSVENIEDEEQYQM